MVEFIKISSIKEVQELSPFEDEYVYDIIMEDSSTPYFFGNGILVHNSNYFATGAETVEDAVIIADEVGNSVNESFPELMKNSFLCTEGYDTLIGCSREIVAERALFQARKKYIAKVVNKDGFPCNKIKAMGSEIKKSDTPKKIQKFLKETVSRILDGQTYEEVSLFVNEQRKKMFKEKISPSEIILLGASKSANNLETFTEAYYAELEGKPKLAKNGKSKLTIPGHVRAAIHYNVLLEEFNDTVSKPIQNADKVKVFELCENAYKFKTIAFPADIIQFPNWFLENFEINLKLSEEKLITNKLEGIFESMSLDVPSPQNTLINSVVQF